MNFFSKAKTGDPQQQVATTAAAKKIVLNFRTSKSVEALAAATLEAGGYVEPPLPREAEIGDNAVLRIGAVIPDGTVYAGVSPDTGKPMYAMPADAPLKMTFSEAQNFADILNAHGHNDWRVPSKGELSVLFKSRAAIGGFDARGSNPDGWYWSATPYYMEGMSPAWGQRFSDGGNGPVLQRDRLSVRCVR